MTDKDGDPVSASTSVTVNNVSPTVTGTTLVFAAVQSLNNVQVATFTDLGTLDTHTAVIDWGDGTITPAAVVESGGSGRVLGSHNYAIVGLYTITVTVTDDDTLTGSATSNVLLAGALLNGGVLTISGTDNRDIIHVHQHSGTIVMHTLLGLASQQNDDDQCEQENGADDEDSDVFTICIKKQSWCRSAIASPRARCRSSKVW